MTKIYVNLNGKKGDFLGNYASEVEAKDILTEARNDDDFSWETFRECYISEEE